MPPGDHAAELDRLLAKLGVRSEVTYNVLCHRKKQYQATASVSVGQTIEFKGMVRSKKREAEQAAAFAAIEHFKATFPQLFPPPQPLVAARPTQIIPIPAVKKAKLPPLKPGTERDRKEVGLKLLSEKYSELNPAGELRWEHVLMDEMRRSFVGFVKPQLPAGKLARFWKLVLDGTPWDQPISPTTNQRIPRKTAWMVHGNCQCTYMYGGLQVAPTIFPKWMDELMETYMPLCGLKSRDEWPNSCNLNLYADGGMSVAWHSDDEPLFHGKFADCAIISLSLGSTRTFEVQLKESAKKDEAAKKDGSSTQDGSAKVIPISLASGDLLTMEGMTQKYYQHRVPKESSSGPRINLTWRWVCKHQAMCPGNPDFVMPAPNLTELAAFFAASVAGVKR